MHATTREDMNNLLACGYKVDDDRLPAPNNKPSARVDTDRPIYKDGWKFNGIDHRKASGC